MRQPPSPLLLSARKRRPRRNPPRGAQFGAPVDHATPEPAQASQSNSEEQCALLQRDSYEPRHTGTSQDDDTPTSSSR
jgi:hypothetical protein